MLKESFKQKLNDIVDHCWNEEKHTVEQLNSDMIDCLENSKFEEVGEDHVCEYTMFENINGGYCLVCGGCVPV